MSIAEKLKQATAQQHRQIEQEVDLLKTGETLEAYQALLMRMYGFYVSWEHKLRKAMLKDDLSIYQNRWKLPSLIADLRDLGFDEREISSLPVTALPYLNDVAAILGAMYVVEGSTLGGKLIATHIQKSLSLQDETGTKFFSIYGKNAAAQWRIFCAWLEEQARKQDEKSIITAACMTFDTMRIWLQDKPFAKVS